MTRVRPARLFPLALICTALVVVAGCGSGGLTLPADAAGTELFEQGQQLLKQEKWSKAAEAFDTLLRNYPTSPYLPDARLGLGRAYYEQGRSDTLLLAVDAFKNFLTFHPSHAQVDYAQLMIAMSYARLMRAPDRDQEYTKKALEEFQAFMEDYPNSTYMDLARQTMMKVIDTLAAHELKVAKFYLGRHRYAAARARCEYAMRKYAGSHHECEILFTAGEASRRLGEQAKAQEFYQRLLSEHQDCRLADKARKRIKSSDN